MRVAVVQMRSTEDVWFNFLQVAAFIREAEAQSCELICFPENVFYRGAGFDSIPDSDRPLFKRDENESLIVRNELGHALADLLASTKIQISLGSVRESFPDSLSKPANAHWFISERNRITSYSKIHLFHFGESYRESDDFVRGTKPVVIPQSEFCFGLSICYDLRFPELFRWMTLEGGAQVLLVPAAFAFETGQAHWESLLRARAIENQAYILAAGQWGSHEGKCGNKLVCYGNSMIIHPWGEILAEARNLGDELLIAEIELSELQRVREKMPALQHRVFRLSCDF